MVDSGGIEKALKQGTAHLAEYAKHKSMDEHHLVIFDIVSNKRLEDKVFFRQQTVRGVLLNTWGL